MNFTRAIAGVTLAAGLASIVPAVPAMADGAASTRNILLGAGAATYLIIQHNRKVHERYAEDARRQAELQSEKNDAWAAYRSEKNANANNLAEISDLKREIAYQHSVIVQQRKQLAMSRTGRAHVAQRVARHVAARHAAARHVAARSAVHANRKPQLAMVSYGWGQI